MKRKYFFFDIDGTLTDKRTAVVVPSAIETVRKLEEAGHFVAIATGRAFYKAIPFAVNNGFHNMVAYGGHAIWLNEELVEQTPMDYDKCLQVYREAIAAGYGVLVTLDDTKDVYANSFRFVEQVGERKEPTRYIIDKDFDPADHDAIFKMYVSVPAGKESDIPSVDTIGHMRFIKDYLMFQPDEKKEGILRMLELTGGDPEDVVVFGDDTNDMEMFAKPFFRIAMGNANEELKAQADYVTDANVDDGIRNACRKFGWID